MTAALPASFPPVLVDAMTASIANGFSFVPGVAAVADTDRSEAPCDGIVSVISFLGDFSWSFTLVLPRPSVGPFSQAFAGFEFPYESSDTGDLVGELANVLAGEISAQLAQRHIKARMSLPTVARGTDVQLVLPEGMPTARLDYSSDCGPFAFKLALAKPPKSWHRRPGAPAAHVAH